MAASGRQLGIADHSQVVDRVNALLLTGGSAFGLDAAQGVMQYVEEQGWGFPTPHGAVPIVPTVVLYDLGLGRADCRPDAAMAYRAAQQARRERIDEGSVGAGTGASIGKIRGVASATKGGIGLWCEGKDGGLIVSAVAAVNAFGDIVDRNKGLIVAGARTEASSHELVDIQKEIIDGRMPTGFGRQNTTLVGVMTNGCLPDGWLRRVAHWAIDALAVHIRPAFTAVDGDSLVALTTDQIPCEPHQVGLLAQRAVGRAIHRAIEQATPLGGLPTAAQVTSRPLVG
jgi:L-aminopeptidase/D-esterase-like protein